MLLYGLSVGMLHFVLFISLFGSTMANTFFSSSDISMKAKVEKKNS